MSDRLNVKCHTVILKQKYIVAHLCHAIDKRYREIIVVRTTVGLFGIPTCKNPAFLKLIYSEALILI